MHKIYENNDVMMYFKKRYCRCCGEILQRKRTERVVRKGDPDHIKYCNIGRSFRPHDDLLVVGKEYYCPSCDRSFSCEVQGDVIKAQKYYQKKIVTDENIRNFQKDEILLLKQKLLKLRWLLLLPVLGGLICRFYISNTKLKNGTEKKDMGKILLASALVFIGMFFVMKTFVSPFIDIGSVDNKNSFLIIVSLFPVNIPTLWYINHTFK